MSAIVVLPASASATLASAAETAIVGLGTGFVHVQGTPAELLAVKSFNRLLRLTAIAHFHKAKTTRASGLAIGDHRNAFYIAEGRKKRLKIRLGGTEREVPDEKFHISTFP